MGLQSMGGATDMPASLSMTKLEEFRRNRYRLAAGRQVTTK